MTAGTTNASENVAFYTDVLGLRLVKKTVNQDDVSAYHLFYGDEVGNPGTEITFFDWPQLRLAPNHPGAGEVSTTELRVPDRAALDWWADRFRELEVSHGGIEENGRAHLGFRKVGQGAQSGSQTVTFEVGEGGPGATVRVVERPDAPWTHLGRGGVHHIAFRTPDDEEHAAWRERIRRSGLGVTPQIDRFYFRSIYFREPGGVLFEIATDGPGFATDEDAAHLGERLSLPPFLEPRPQAIEAGLEPLAARLRRGEVSC